MECLNYESSIKVLQQEGNIGKLMDSICDQIGDSHHCKLGAVIYTSNIQLASLFAIRNTFRIPMRFVLMSAIADNKAHPFLDRYIIVYREQMKAGLRFLLHYLFIDIMKY